MISHTLLEKMMRKLFVAMSMLLCMGANAQNIQFHYDLGKAIDDDLDSRPSFTTTVELFKTDKWGSTFFFVDLDYLHDGVAGAYWEVAREVNITNNKQWAAHVEYNGGMASNKYSGMSTRYQHAFLAGPAWNIASADYSKTLSLQTMYKDYFKGQNAWNRPFNSFQATAVWGVHFAGRKFSFLGFIDCWYDQSVRGNWITISEPQLWFNINTLKGCKDINLSVGTEVEISNNFVFDDKGRNDRFHAIPTIAAKWTF